MKLSYISPDRKQCLIKNEYEFAIVITVQAQVEFAEVTLPVNANMILVNLPDVESDAGG